MYGYQFTYMCRLQKSGKDHDHMYDFLLHFRVLLGITIKEKESKKIEPTQGSHLIAIRDKKAPCEG